MLRRDTAKRAAVVAVALTMLLSLTGSAAALPKIKKLERAQQNPITGRYTVSGTKILGPDGKQFIPRGVNKGGLEWMKTGYDESYWNYQRAKNWGANVIRIPLSSAFALPRMCTYDKNYMARVDKIVNWGQQLGMLVILDDHVSTKGLTCGTGKWATGLQKQADIHNLDFVKLLAKRYKDKGWVAIDLFNEPHDIPDSIWRNGGVVDGYRSVGMQQLLDGVRSTGNQNLVFATGNLWGNDLRMVVNNPLLNDKNVVYAAHTYPFYCAELGGTVYYETPYWCHGKQYPPFLDTQIAPAVAKRAVMITEFGTQRSIPGEMQAPIDWAEAHHIGWAAWLWGNGKMTDFCLLDANGNPSISGKPVKDSLARFAAK
jgi:endoglucanase